jgi:Ca2+:H+ antiporter
MSSPVVAPPEGTPPPPERDRPRSTGAAALRELLFSRDGWPYLLLPLIPVAVVLEVVHAGPALIFFASALGVVPTAALMGRATEELAERTGPGIGGLLNVTFGNFPELVIAFFALIAGLHEVVKASIIGSIISNVLLVMGAAMFVGGLGRDRQRFSGRAASSQATMLILASAALAMPAVFQLVEGGGLPPVGAERIDFNGDVEWLSLAVAVVLLVSYSGGLWFSLKSHRDLFNPPDEEDVARADDDEEQSEPWPVKRSVILLALSGVAVGLMSEILVGSISETAETIGLSEFFIGVIVVAVVGNAAEHWVAVYVAAKDKMDLAVNIAIGSSAQVALFVAPVLVLLSFLFGPAPLPLVFNGFELSAVFLAVLIASHVARDGESTWFEGLQLLSVYAVLGLTFLFA